MSLSEYEKERLRTIAENHAKLASLGIAALLNSTKKQKRKKEQQPRPDLDLPAERRQCSRFQKAIGLKWRPAGRTLPTDCEEIVNKELSEALEEKTYFTPRELASFGILGDNLHIKQAIKARDMYFRPSQKSNSYYQELPRDFNDKVVRKSERKRRKPHQLKESIEKKQPRATPHRYLNMQTDSFLPTDTSSKNRAQCPSCGRVMSINYDGTLHRHQCIPQTVATLGPAPNAADALRGYVY